MLLLLSESMFGTKRILLWGIGAVLQLKAFGNKVRLLCGIIKEMFGVFLGRKHFSKLQLRRRKIFPSMALVIDLDETLIRAKKLMDHSDTVGVEVPINSRYIKYQVEKRPHVHYFLSQLYPLYEIVLYTAGKREYAEAVIGHIDIDQFVDRRLCREECNWDTQRGCYVKDLKRVRSDISRVILLDDSLEAASNFPENFIQVPSWNGNRSDAELLDLLPLLVALRKVKNVRFILQLRTKSFSDFCQLFVKQHPHLHND